MQKKAVYQGVFTNKSGCYTVEVSNDFKVFEMVIGDFRFRGIDLDSFELVNVSDFSEEELLDFDFFKGKDGEGVCLELVNYELELKLPFVLIDMESMLEFDVLMDFRFVLGELNQKVSLSVCISDVIFEAHNGFMELALDDLQGQFKGGYRFKNCYGCLFGDYSVYGQGLMGPVLCFKNQRDAYLMVSDKNEYMGLGVCDSMQQEFFCCSEYEIRDSVVGYRGTVI